MSQHRSIIHASQVPAEPARLDSGVRPHIWASLQGEDLEATIPRTRLEDLRLS